MIFEENSAVISQTMCCYEIKCQFYIIIPIRLKMLIAFRRKYITFSNNANLILSFTRTNSFHETYDFHCPK